MMETVRISPENQITLSSDSLARLGVKAGDQVEIRTNDEGGLEIRRKRTTFADLRGIVKLNRPVTDEELNRWATEARGRIVEGDAEE
jgi:bifunctional DNA-binding transcriptional regulator/antitoxin component of YhaV-PrlF toxin-antitoxin module